MLQPTLQGPNCSNAWHYPRWCVRALQRNVDVGHVVLTHRPTMFPAQFVLGMSVIQFIIKIISIPFTFKLFTSLDNSVPMPPAGLSGIRGYGGSDSGYQGGAGGYQTGKDEL